MHIVAKPHVFVNETERLIKDALLELLAQNKLSEISVTAICAAADVNRSTFYTYYTGPSDLLRDIEQDVLDRIPSPLYPQNQHGEECLTKKRGRMRILPHI